MAQRARGGWSPIFMARIIMLGSVCAGSRDDGSSLCGSDSDQASDGQRFQPVLQPSEASPLIGTYDAMDKLAGKVCVKATMGMEYIISENKKTWYYNVDPKNVTTSGVCSNDSAIFELTLPNNAASLVITFKKEGNVSYVTTVNAHITPQPACKECETKYYAGEVDHAMMFETFCGLSFKCSSQVEFDMSSSLKIKLVPLQIQAFDVPEEQYGPEVECWPDLYKRAIPIVVGASVTGIFLVAVVTCLIVRERSRHQGYTRI